MQSFPNTYERDIALDLFDVDTELRRLSTSLDYGLEAGDLGSVRVSGSYVRSSCIDVWCAVTNKHLSEVGRNDVFIITMPTSEAIFFTLTGVEAGEDLDAIGNKWARWKKPELKNLLIPVNLFNEHWCLLVVDLETKIIGIWDSLIGYDGGEYIGDKKDRLFDFLEAFTGGKGSTRKHWDVQLKMDVSQQQRTDCGVFCIEFMRAFINGCKVGQELMQIVKQDKMVGCRKHILREINERQFLTAIAHVAQPGAENTQKRRRRKKVYNDFDYE